jgi:hypothetical protein
MLTGSQFNLFNSSSPPSLSSLVSSHVHRRYAPSEDAARRYAPSEDAARRRSRQCFKHHHPRRWLARFRQTTVETLLTKYRVIYPSSCSVLGDASTLTLRHPRRVLERGTIFDWEASNSHIFPRDRHLGNGERSFFEWSLSVWHPKLVLLSPFLSGGRPGRAPRSQSRPSSHRLAEWINGCQHLQSHNYACILRQYGGVHSYVCCLRDGGCQCQDHSTESASPLIHANPRGYVCSLSKLLPQPPNISVTGPSKSSSR